MGDYPQALRLLKTHFERDHSLTELDHHKIDLLKAIWLLQQGKMRPGLKGVHRALARVPESELTWYQAQARSAVVALAKSQIQGLVLTGSQRKITKILTEQATLVKLAEAQLEATVQLESSHWILHQIHDIGDSYALLGQHLWAPPSVAALSDEERRSYEAQVKPRVENVFVKALKYYDLESNTPAGCSGPATKCMSSRRLAVRW